MEFQAVIFAGGSGSRMSDLTVKTPKALLPIANMPMVWYPVNMLRKAGFQEAIIIVKESHKADVKKALVEICQVKMQLDFVGIPDDEDWGTADSLRHISSKIKTDIILVSCDLVSDISLHLLADVHRTNDATVTALMAPLPEIPEGQVPGGKANRKIEKDFVGMDEKCSQMLFLSSEADLDDNIITFRKSFLKKHSFVELRSGLMDAHLYLMKKSVLELLKNEQGISTIKGELLPKLVRKQFSSEIKSDEEESNLNMGEDVAKDIARFSRIAQEMSTYTQSKDDSSVKCYLYVMEGGYCVRTNSIATYYEASKHVPRHLVTGGAEFTPVHPTVILSKSTVGADSIVGEGCSIGEKVAIKKSTIGRHCVIGDRVKITNSVIMDYTRVDAGCIVNGCIFSQNVEIGEKSELKDTVVASGQKVDPMGKYSNEAIVERDRMMEV